MARVAEEKQRPTAPMTLDEALQQTGFGRFNACIILLSGLVMVGMITETVGLSFIMPAAQCDLNLSHDQKGWLSALPFIGIIMSAHAWGWAADTRGRRKVLVWSCGLSATVSILSSFAPNLASFAALRLVAALFVAGPTAVTYAYLGEFCAPRHRDRVVALGSTFVGIGTVSLPAISWLILPHEWSLDAYVMIYRPWRLLVIAFALPYALSALLLLEAPESPKFLHAVGRDDDSLSVLRLIYSCNTRNEKHTYPVTSLVPAVREVNTVSILRSMWIQTAPLFQPPLLKWTALACFVQLGIFASANGFYIWFPTILNQLANHEGEPSTICEILTDKPHISYNATESLTLCTDVVDVSTYYKAILTGLVFCSMYVLVAVLVDWVGKRTILVTVLCFAGACGIAADSVREQNGAVALFGLFQMCGSCIGMMTAVVVQLFPTHLRAMAVSLSMMSGRVGSILGTNLIGFFMKTDCELSFYIFGGLLIVCAALCLTLPSEREPRSAADDAAVGCSSTITSGEDPA